MIVGYAFHGQDREVLVLFYQMRQNIVNPDHYVVANVPRACAGIASLELDKQVHADIVKSGFQWDLVLFSTVVDIYANDIHSWEMLKRT
jgi:hypothetical protein